MVLHKNKKNGMAEDGIVHNYISSLAGGVANDDGGGRCD